MVGSQEGSIAILCFNISSLVTLEYGQICKDHLHSTTKREYQKSASTMGVVLATCNIELLFRCVYFVYSQEHTLRLSS